MKAYLKKEIFLVHQAWLRKDKLVEKATSFSNSLDFDDKAKIKDMIRIAENCKDMAAFI